MRHVFKYLLAAAVILGGFSTAQHYRIQPPRESDGTLAEAEREAEPGLDPQNAPNRAAGQRPLAALIDVDRLHAPTDKAIGQLDLDRAAHELTGQPAPARVQKPPTVARPVQPAAEKQLAPSATPSSTETKVCPDPRPTRPEEPSAKAADGPRSPARNAGQDKWTPGDHVKPKPKQKKLAKEMDALADDKPREPPQMPAARVEARASKDSRKNRSPALHPTIAPAEDWPLPEFAETYHPWLQPLDEFSEEPADQVRRQDKPPDNNRVAARNAVVGQPGATSAQPAGPRRHRIVDGDTLRRLAERYLGAADQYLAIFEANRDVLFDPRLLPIGFEIVLPPRAKRDPTPAPSPRTETASADGAGEDGGLVPIPHFSRPRDAHR
jgi:nucleoid-associated protein YgaU